ncbi:hypothetical protein [Achromobacter xylosoxidans]|uniref:hypothetical protein n=1 Tax=Alcaligenes xylosoxydans xylosoxydans TaxID=85698 RepID=UPI002D21CBEF|nr:hypothetical protein [Achromobacter xylosoxidans]
MTRGIADLAQAGRQVVVDLGLGQDRVAADPVDHAGAVEADGAVGQEGGLARAAAFADVGLEGRRREAVDFILVQRLGQRRATRHHDLLRQGGARQGQHADRRQRGDQGIAIEHVLLLALV